MKNKQKIDYLSNEEFLNDIKEWQESNQEEIPDKIAKKIKTICENLTRSGKFVLYTWKDDFISDGIYNCLKAVRNFDTNKSKNPFAYFTMIAYNSFLCRIKSEKHNLEKIEAFKEDLNDLFETDTDESDDKCNIQENVKKFNRDYSKYKRTKKIIRTKNNKQRKNNKNDIMNFID